MNLTIKRIYRFGCFVLAMLLLFEVTGIGKVLMAQMDIGITSYVEYNEEKTEATIRFDFQKFDLEANPITSIKAIEEQRDIYVKDSQTDVQETSYSVNKNGIYHFTITYEKQEQEDAVEEIDADKMQIETDTAETETEEAELKAEEQQMELSVNIDEIEETEIVQEEQPANEEKIVSEEKPKAALSAAPISALVSQPGTETDLGDVKIDLRDQFDIKSFAYDFTTKNRTQITDVEKNVCEHSIIMTNPERTDLFYGNQNADAAYDYQTTAIQSKKTYDMTRPFSLSGTIDLGEGVNGASDGLTIGFTGNKSYLESFDGSGQGGSLGIYKDATNSGIGNGIVAEIDTWGNTEDSGGISFGDGTEKRNNQVHDAHLDINGVKNDIVSNLTDNNEWYIGEAANLNNQTAVFKLTWEPSDSTGGTMVLTFNDKKASAYIADLTQYISDTSNAYLIFTTASGNEYNYPYKPSKVVFTFDNFTYDDIDPKVKLEYTMVYPIESTSKNTKESYSTAPTMVERKTDVEAYVQNNEIILVKFTLSNNKLSNNTFNEMLYLTSAQLGNIKAEVVSGQIKYAIGSATAQRHAQNTFDDEIGLPVQYPSQSQVYTLYFYIRFQPELDLNILDGELPLLDLQFTIGEKGMTQHVINRKIAVFSKPNVKNTDAHLINQDILTKQALQTRMTSGKTFDDTIYHSAYYDGVTDNAIRIKENTEKYLKFDDETDSWRTITDTEFLNHSLSGSNETGVYAYEYSIIDNRRSDLNRMEEKPSDVAVSRYFLSNEDVIKANGYMMLMNGKSLKINVNDIKSKYNTEEKLTKYILEQLSVKAYKTKDNDGENLRKVTKIENTASIDFISPEIKTYTMTLLAYDNDYGNGTTPALQQEITVEVYDVNIEVAYTQSIINKNGDYANYDINATRNYDYSIPIPQRDLTKALTINDTWETVINFKNADLSENEETIAVQIPEAILGNSASKTKLQLKAAKYGGHTGNFTALTDEEIKALSDGGTAYITVPAEQGMTQLSCYFAIPKDYSYSVDVGGTANDLPLAAARVNVSNTESAITAITAFNPVIKGVRYDVGVNANRSIQPRDVLIRGRTYDNSEFLVPNNDVTNGFSVLNEKYYYFDDTQFAEGQDSTEEPKGKYVEITQEQFINHMKDRKNQTEIYAYGAQIQDKRRIIDGTPNLVSPVTYGKYYMTKKKDGEATEAVRAGNYLIMANDHELNFKDTEISANFATKEQFVSYIEKQLSLKGYKDIFGTLNTELVSLTYEGKTKDIDEFLKNPTGDFIIQAQIKNSDGMVLASKDITINVSENAWSYDTPNRTEENGASGYIVIPRAVQLKENQGTKQLTATSEVYYANYQSAINDVQYQVTVDKQFQLTNTKISTEKLNVTTTGGTDKGTLVDLGTLSKLNQQGSGVKVTFSTPVSKETKKLGRWEGNVNFYFQRVTP